MIRSIKIDARIDLLALEFVVCFVFNFSFGLLKKHIYMSSKWIIGLIPFLSNALFNFSFIELVCFNL